MATTILLQREGNKLGACDTIGHELIVGMRHGEQVLADIKRARNPKHHRLMFALLQLALDNQDKHKDIDSLLNAIKVATGHCKWLDMMVRDVPVRVAVPKSISFASMRQDKFEKFFDAALDYLANDVLGRADKEAIRQEIINNERKTT